MPLTEVPQCKPILSVDMANKIVHICAHARNAIQIMDGYREIDFRVSHGICGDHYKDQMQHIEEDLIEGDLDEAV